MEILEAYDLTKSLRSAAGSSDSTVSFPASRRPRRGA